MLSLSDFDYETNGERTASIAADFIPVFGQLKMLGEIVEGKDLVSGKHYSTGDQLFGLGTLGAGSLLGKIYKGIKTGMSPEVEEAAGKLSNGTVFAMNGAGGASEIEKLTKNITKKIVGKGEEASEGVRNPNAKEIISERVSGLDLNEHQLTNKQLSSKKMSEIKSKIDNRTVTKAEYEAYEWNKRFSARRREGVKQFWNQERERIINGESTTRNWTTEQIEDILNGRTPKYDGKPIQGHHSYSASQYPHLADKGEIIYPVTPNEHLKGWHGGNFKNSSPGEPIIDINDF
nr:pre-toxin TG domain-containing protein [Clostridium kluyveri]